MNPSLDDATLLVGDGSDSLWRLTFRPNVGEASLTEQRGARSLRASLKLNGRETAGAADPERSRLEAGRRASSSIRRIACEHRLTRLVTCTLTEKFATSDRVEMIKLVREFQRRIKARWPEMVYIAVLELHPGGHGYHLHMVVDRYIPHAVWVDVWGKGIVDVRKIRDKTGGGARASARRAASYIAKYVAKDADDEARKKGEHRFFRPQNIQMVVVVGEGTFHSLLALLRLRLERGQGQKVQWCWWSGDVPQEEWHGPPVFCVRW